MTDKIKYSSISVAVAVIGIIIGAASATVYHGMNLQVLRTLQTDVADIKTAMKDVTEKLPLTIYRLDNHDKRIDKVEDVLFPRKADASK